MAQYTTGTVSLATGSINLTGSGTNWLTSGIISGWLMSFDTVSWYQVASVNSDTSITLSTPFLASPISGATYSATNSIASLLAAPANTPALRNGSGAPSHAANAGDFYLDLNANVLYGPYTTSWPGTGITLNPVIPILKYGTGAPVGSSHAGDFYLDTTGKTLYGPYTSSWPGSGIPLNSIASTQISDATAVGKSVLTSASLTSLLAYIFSSAPTSDPHVSGQLWNDGGAVVISAG